MAWIQEAGKGIVLQNYCGQWECGDLREYVSSLAGKTLIYKPQEHSLNKGDLGYNKLPQATHPTIQGGFF